MGISIQSYHLNKENEESPERDSLTLSFYNPGANFDRNEEDWHWYDLFLFKRKVEFKKRKGERWREKEKLYINKSSEIC